MTLGSNNEAAKYGTRPRVPINEPKNNKQPPRHILTVAPIASIVKKGTSEVNLDLPTEFNSLFNSIKSGVQTGVKSAVKAGQDTRIRFSLEPFPGDPSYIQWKDAMKMVARLPEGVPTEFRKKLWLTLAEQYLGSKGVEWKKAERTCFNEWSNPDDDELGLQIVRDLHRTGCSLFCGEDAEANQLMLKRVLLAYARWNKSIGYCQGFNMLAAIILEVMEKAESDALKVMIFMIEGILPECYFTNNLRGLSVDMAVFRDLLGLRLPKLSKHLDDLQNDANDGCSPANYEPPLTNVFTMQWFLTLFSTCLPSKTVLRVWDLILLEGNEVLLRTALAIWKGLEERVLLVKSADEFYCAMGHLSQEMLQFSAVDSNMLIKTLVDISPFPFTEVPELREKYTYNITPWSQGIAVAKRGIRILYSDDEDNLDEDEENIAVAATFGVATMFKSPRKTLPASGSGKGLIRGPSQQNVDKERLTVDISALKQQYRKLRQRQQQAHIILTSALTKNGPMGQETESRRPNGSSGNPVAMNHLLLGKKPLVATKPRRAPHPGAIPSPKVKRTSNQKQSREETRRASVSATHYSCPQPEVVPPSELKKGKKKHRRKSSSSGQVVSSMGSKVHNNDDKSSSSSTEVGCDNGNATDLETDLEEIPKDYMPVAINVEQDVDKGLILKESSVKLRMSCSSNELMNKTDGMGDKNHHSESDLLMFEQAKNGTTDNRQFYEDLLKEFDEPAEQQEETEDGKNGLALQIMKKNSEILERLLSKKSSVPCPEVVDGPTNSGLVTTLAKTVQQEKRRVSQTSSNGSSSSCIMKNNITLQSSPATKPITFNPFPNCGRTNRKPKEVGRKLGLYK